MLAGHSPQNTTARNYEHLSPTYLNAAVAAIDALFDELSKHTQVHLRYASDTEHKQALAAQARKSVIFNELGWWS